MGNICRSPAAEAVFKKMVKEAGLTDKVIVDSAGTHGYHVGEAPDVRAQIAGRKRGYDLSELRARQITSDDFRECDFILAMDWENLTAMQQICPPMYKHKLALLMRYATEYDTAVVPDPYYGGNEGFNTVLDYCEDACEGLLEVVKKRASVYISRLSSVAAENSFSFLALFGGLFQFRLLRSEIKRSIISDKLNRNKDETHY